MATKFWRNYALPFYIGLTVSGVLLTVVPWTLAYVEVSTTWMNWYRSILSPINNHDWVKGDVNLYLMIAGPILLVSAAWYVGEQVSMRRKFERLFETDKKSDFAKNKKELDDLARDLPDDYRQRIKDKESNLRAR